MAASTNLNEVTAETHPNIALVKYWGKREGAGNLPAVGSMSITLDTFLTRTTVRPDPELRQDACTLNGEAADPRSAARWRALLAQVRAGRSEAGATVYAHVRSHNNFPTGAGLASSASGFAALALAASHAYNLTPSATELSALARSGSGSAARSVFGGFVAMDRGSRADGRDAVAAPLAPAEHWPLRVVVAITQHGAKAVSSTEGMERTRATSPFWPAWLMDQASDLAAAGRAVADRDFAALAEVAEHSCLKMHALAQAAKPGLMYFTPATLAALAAVRALQAEGVPVFFTIDAGPQLKAVCLAEAEAKVAAALAAVPGVLEVVRLGLGAGARIVAGP